MKKVELLLIFVVLFYSFFSGCGQPPNGLPTELWEFINNNDCADDGDQYVS